MAGRKRKAGVREPNGRLDRKEAESSYSPAAVKRLMDSAITAASDYRLGTEIGRLLLHGKLTHRQAAAGWRYSELRAEYVKAIEAPQVKTARLERGQKGEAPEEGTAAGDAITATTRRAVQRYNRADAIIAASGKEAANAVRLLCQDVALLGHQQLLDARSALDALAGLFATGRSKHAERD